MITPEQRSTIRRLFFAEHWKIGTIAADLGLHRDAVERAIEPASFTNLAHRERAKALDSFKGFVVATLEEHPRLCATRVLEMIRQRGYLGSVWPLRRFIRRSRPTQHEAFFRLTTLPGEQAQVDWASFGTITIGSATRKLSCFVMVLSWSRAVFARFVLDQTLESFLLCHVEAFGRLGVARSLLYDNLKTAVLERSGDVIRFHPRLLDSWVDTIAHQRLVPRDELKRTVAQAFDEERPRLLPLPEHPFPCDYVRAVASGKTPYVRFDRNDYSIPHTHVRKPITLVASSTTVRLLDGLATLAVHERSYDRGRQLECEAHLVELAAEKRKAREHRGRNRLASACSNATRFLEHVALHGGHLGGTTSRLLRLLDQHGARDLDGALVEACARTAFTAHSVAHILDQKRRAAGAPAPFHPTLPDDPRVRDLDVPPHSLATYDVLGARDDGKTRRG